MAENDDKKEVVLIIDPISKPVAFLKGIGNGIANGTKKAASAIKRAFTPKKRR
jgi:hypothetical protein